MKCFEKMSKLSRWILCIAIKPQNTATLFQGSVAQFKGMESISPLEKLNQCIPHIQLNLCFELCYKCMLLTSQASCIHFKRAR